MKKAILNPITFFLAVIAASLASCATETYADKRKAEKAAFDNYRQRNNLEFSTDSAYCFSLPAPWPENLYFQTHRGAYVRLIKHDPEARPVAHTSRGEHRDKRRRSIRFHTGGHRPMLGLERCRRLPAPRFGSHAADRFPARSVRSIPGRGNHTHRNS